MIQSIIVAGAGTMGSGIALSAAQNGFNVILFDTNVAGIERGRAAINKNLDYLLQKQKITAAENSSINNRIHYTSHINDCKADLIIEAIVEITSAKIELFNQLATINSEDCIFASNTSSLSISAIQQTVTNPERVAGMHFFNPAQIMKLVEIVKGNQTADTTIAALKSVCLQMKKTPVLCKDAPGFIVNRVARHFYLESLKLVENNVISFEKLDELMEASGFKMGPFKLMDLIGMDINLAVSESLYKAFDNEPRFKPSALQIEKVANGQLGKKSGRGFYDYSNY